MTKHSPHSPSAMKRILSCTGSYELCANLPDHTSDFAQEGTDAHELCQYLVLKAMGKNPKDPTTGLQYYNSEMQRCAEEYRDYVVEQLLAAENYCEDPIVLIEQTLDFSPYALEGSFGTADCVIIADDILHVIDYKHGLGVIVSAEMNPQMLCYALGALNLFDAIYDINTIKMTIFQPRRDNISTYEVSKEDLLTWASDVLKPKLKEATEGKGEFRAGDHCIFCKAKSTCRKRAEYNLEMAKYDFAVPDTLTPEEVSIILTKIDDLTSWAADVKEYALKQAMTGTTFEGFKVVEGRSNRKYTDESMVAAIVSTAGFDPYEKKVKGITTMTAELGKIRFNELLSCYVYKPQGKPVLVPTSDKRPVMNTAKEDFKEE